MGMELPIAAIRQQIASGIDVIVHLGRLPDKSRRVLEITEVCGIKNGNIVLSSLYRLDGNASSWNLRRCGTLQNCSKLEMAGISLPKEEEYHELPGLSSG